MLFMTDNLMRNPKVDMKQLKRLADYVGVKYHSLTSQSELASAVYIKLLEDEYLPRT
jgi:hypothetical protein